MPRGRAESLYDRLAAARAVLDLPEEATLSEIKKAFRKKIRMWHPDKVGEDSPEHANKSRQIIEANKIIMDYADSFKISFAKDTVNRYCSDEEFWWGHFGNDPMWGPGTG
jgi:curved DNA-binding protein CbpA